MSLCTTPSSVHVSAHGQPCSALTGVRHGGRSPPSTCMRAAASKQVYTVTMVLPNGTEAVFRAGTGSSSKSLYDIASYAGLHLPASCKQGTCSACCAKLLSGRVSQPKQHCLPPELLKQGYVALCCATPASDVKLQTHQGAAIRKWKAEHHK